MKKFIVKNYKGNLVESLKRFSVSHEDMKIVNAREANDGLIIEAIEDIEKSDVEIPDFEILDCHATGKTFKSKDKDGKEVTLKEFICAVKDMGKKHDQIFIRAKDEDEARDKLYMMYAPLPTTFKIEKAFEAEEPKKIGVEESGALNIKNAKKIGIVELNLKTGQAKWIANDNRDVIRIEKSKLNLGSDDDYGNVGFVSGAKNSEEMMAAAKYIIADLTNTNKEHLESGVISANKAYAIIPYTGRALAEWIGSMAKKVANEYLNGD